MRITIVQGTFLPVPPLLGGAVEKVWFNLGKAFAARGHQVTHLSRAYPGLPAEETIEGVRHLRRSGFTAPDSFGKRMALDLWFALRLLPLLPKADILVTNTFWLPVFARQRRHGVPYVHVARYPKGQMKLYRRAVLQTVSAPIRDAILAEDPTAAERVRVIPYPLSPAYLRSQITAGERTILYTGRVHPEKGLELLVEAFVRSKPAAREQWRLEIVGPWEYAYGGGGEDYLAKLRALAQPAGDRVVFVGRIFDEAKLIERYSRARIFVYPSVAEKGETFGLAALEAMAAGCAPIVSSLECFQDFVAAGRNGEMFNHRSAAAIDDLVSVLGRLIEDPVLLHSIRDQAWRDARGYTLDRVTEQFLADFSKLCPAPRG